MAPDERSSINTLNMVYLIETLKYISEKEPITLRELKKKCEFCSIHTLRNLLETLYRKTNPRNKLLDFRLIKYVKDKNTGIFREWNNNYVNGGETYYYRIEFNTKKSEIKLLADALSMFPFLSSEQTVKLIKSIEQICSIPDLTEVRKIMEEYDYKAIPEKSLRSLYHSNEFFKVIEIITEAMKIGKCIKFDYCMYASNPEKNRLVFAKRSEKIFHPAFFMWSNGYYYIVGKDENMLELGFFNLRVERIQNVEILRNLEICEIEYINPAKYRDENPVMYGGNIETIEFRAMEKLLNAVIDSFGKNIQIKPTDYTSKGEEYILVTAKSSLEGAAMWLTEYCNCATALAPVELVNKVKATLLEGLSNY